MCGKMATNTTNDEKYSRLVLMLVKGGTKITKALFEKRFKAMTPEDHDPSPWTIDEFLQANKKKILSNQTGRAKKQMFFPLASGTEIDLWDLYMFCFVLVDVCGASIAIRMDIDQLKKIRNKLCHLSKPSVDTPMYEKNVLKIKYSFDRLLAEIDDKLLTEEIAKVIQAAKEEPLSHQDTISVLHAFSKMEEETREMLSQHSKDITEIRGKMIEMEKKVDLILKNQKPNQTETVKVPEIIIELLVKNCDSDNEVIISKLLVDMYKEVTGRSSSDKHSKEEYSKMMAAVRDIVDRFTTKDRSIVDAEQGCIIFRIRCSSVASLVSLFDDCIAGNLNKEFKPLEACIREIKGCEEVTLEPVIFEDEFWKTISQTISSLEEMISRLYNTEFQSSVGNQNNAISSISDVNLVERLSPTTEDEKRIHHAVRLTIRTDQDGKEQLKESVKNGSFDSSINRLREEVVDHYDLTKLSIEARVVDEESQCFADADQFLVNIQSNEFTDNYKEDNLKEDTRVSWKINVGAVSKEHEDEYEKNVSRDSDIAIHASPVKMADKYDRLVCFVVNICAELLRDLFIKLARNDAGASYTTIDAYLTHRKSDVNKLRAIRKDQYKLLYPGHGTTDVNQWGVTLLVTLITELFYDSLQQHEISVFKDEIRGIHNELQHLPNTNISDVDLDKYWTRLNTAVMSIAKQTYVGANISSFKKKVEDAKSNYLPSLGKSLHMWYGEKLKEMDDKLSELQSKKRKTTPMLHQETVQKPGPYGGIKNKRIKTADNILAKLQVGFERTMNTLQKDFCSPEEVATIRTRLRDDHFVVVTGSKKSRYTEAALAAIKEIDYNYKRCVKMSKSSDWRHINPEDVDLVFCRNPFGSDQYDENKAKRMADIFDSMILTAKGDIDKKIDIVIVTDLAVFTECQQYHDHDILGKVVKVYDEQRRLADLTLDLSDRLSSAYDHHAKFLQRLSQRQSEISNPLPLSKQHIWSIESTLNFDIRVQSDRNLPFILGCCLLPSGEILLADRYNQRLKKLDPGYKVISVLDLPDPPDDVCYIGNNEAVASCGKQLQYIDIRDGMSLITSVKTDHWCYGLACHDDKLYVTEAGSVYSYSTSGTKQRVMYTHQSHIYTFAINDTGDRIYLAYLAAGLKIFDQMWNNLYTYNDIELSVTGVCVDNENNVFVYDKMSGKILQISSDGQQKLGIQENGSRSIHNRETMLFDKENKALLLAGYSGSIDVLKLK